MQRIGNLNGENITYDHDISGLVRGLTDGGVIEGGTVVGNKLQPVQAIVPLVRSNGQKILAFFESDEVTDLPTTGDYKVYIEVDQSKIDFGGNNAEDGTGIASIKTGPTLPSQNFLLLASVTAGQVKDERNLIPKVGQIAQRTTTLEEKVSQAEQKVGRLEEAGTPDHLALKIIPNSPVSPITYRNLFPIGLEKHYTPSSINTYSSSITQTFQLLETPTSEFVYFSFLFCRKKKGESNVTVHLGETANYGNIKGEGRKQVIKFNPQQHTQELIVKVPKDKVPNQGNFKVTFDLNFLSVPIFRCSAQEVSTVLPGYSPYIYFGTGQSYEYAACLYILEPKNSGKLNIIGKTQNPVGFGVGTNPAIGVSLDASEGSEDVIQPRLAHPSLKYKKASTLARRLSIKNQNIIKNITITGGFEDLNGDFDLSLYKADKFGNLDQTQKVFTKKFAKNLFPKIRTTENKIFQSCKLEINTTLEKNTDYYLVIEGGLICAYVEGTQKKFNEYSSGLAEEVGVFVPGECEVSRTRSQVVVSIMSIIEKTNLQDRTKDFICIEWGPSSPVTFAIKNTGRLLLNVPQNNKNDTFTFKYKEFYVSETGLGGLTQDYGMPDIGVDFDNSNVKKIKVILPGGVLNLPDANLIPGQIYGLKNGELVGSNGADATVGIALTQDKILIKPNSGINYSAKTGFVPLGNALGFMEIDGHNVPVYG